MGAMGSLRVGHALAEDTDIGPVVDQRQLDQDLDYLRIGCGEGAELAAGGELVEGARRGCFLRPPSSSAPATTCGLSRGDLRAGGSGHPRRRLRACPGDRKRHAVRPLGRHLHPPPRPAADFKRRAQAGMVMVNLATAGVDFHVAFGGRRLVLRAPRAGRPGPRVLHPAQDGLHQPRPGLTARSEPRPSVAGAVTRVLQFSFTPARSRLTATSHSGPTHPTGSRPLNPSTASADSDSWEVHRPNETLCHARNHRRDHPRCGRRAGHRNRRQPRPSPRRALGRVPQRAVRRRRPEARVGRKLAVYIKYEPWTFSHWKDFKGPLHHRRVPIISWSAAPTWKSFTETVPAETVIRPATWL